MDLRGSFETPAPAIVLAEGEFGQPGGKTANGVVAHSELFDARAVIDSTQAGRPAGEVLDLPGGQGDDVPCVASLAAAREAAPEASVLVIGVAPAGGALPPSWIETIEGAMAAGCDVVSGLHTFLSDADRWQTLAADHGVRLFDVRKPPDTESLQVADGGSDRSAQVVCTLGTDCAAGKRTTTFELYRAAKRAGYDASWVATGQTGIMVGAHRGVVVDRVPSDFAAGVVERLVGEAAADHELVFVEGQAALTHRAYSGVTLSILHGAWPDAVVLADDPSRERRTHFEQFPVAGIERERRAIDAVSPAPTAAVSTWGDPDTVSEHTGLPAANTAHDGGPDRLLAAVEQQLS